MKCTYCGLTCDSVDHVPPKSARLEIISTGLVMKYPFIEVPACRECNSALGARGFWTIKERREYIKSYLKEKYGKYLILPKWSPSDLDDVSKSLGVFIKNSLVLKEIIKERLNYRGSLGPVEKEKRVIKRKPRENKSGRQFWPRVERKNFTLECLCAFDFKVMRFPRKNQLYCSQVCKQRAFQFRKDLKDEAQKGDPK
jgi:hypothetical protein